MDDDNKDEDDNDDANSEEEEEEEESKSTLNSKQKRPRQKKKYNTSSKILYMDCNNLNVGNYCCSIAFGDQDLYKKSHRQFKQEQSRRRPNHYSRY
ncbi:hypothetical protein RFI_24008 [Reticulomyxa filosa]|uniref:Uncharacterized protein n=1 Tax=Reticulomyxa filosa TaxID=46433 RepID=X6MIB9_RETFI|nr:hypothetical protein RFI_24008 [Reticulomyxa filosa]|eukprot:ETO13366.1 hypothetical protein RFI_24008 [Reticulomyxa filosa]